MEPSEQPRGARRSAGECLFQLATIAREVADNRRELTEHVAKLDERMVRLDVVFKLLDEIDAGTEPTVDEINFTFGFPTLNDAAWQSAERTGAVALLEYAEVQRLAQLSSAGSSSGGTKSTWTWRAERFALP
jgi:hypothetical protein